MKKTKAVKEESVVSEYSSEQYRRDAAKTQREALEGQIYETARTQREAMGMSMPAFDSKITGSALGGLASSIPGGIIRVPSDWNAFSTQATTYAISEGCEGLDRKQMLEAAQWLIDALDKDEVEDE